MAILSSITLGAVQATGKTRVIETHISDNYPGKRLTREYEAFVDPGHPEYVNPAEVMQLRHDRLEEEEAATERAKALAGKGRFGLNKYEWRQKFTAAEQTQIDAFNEGGFETHPALTPDQKTEFRRQMRNYAATPTIDLDNPDVATVLSLYEALSLIAAGRAAEILNG